MEKFYVVVEIEMDGQTKIDVHTFNNDLQASVFMDKNKDEFNSIGANIIFMDQEDFEEYKEDFEHLIEYC